MAQPSAVQTSMSTSPGAGPAGTIDSTTAATVKSRLAASALTPGLLALFVAAASTVRAPVAADSATDVDAIIATGASTAGVQTLTTTALDGAVGDDLMRLSRNLTFTFSSHADWDATTITVTGKDAFGEYLTETFAVPNGGNATVTGNALFSQVDSVSIPAQAGTGGTFTMGVGAKLGPLDAAAAGVVALENTRSAAAYASAEVAPIVRQGRIRVTTEEAVAEGNDVYVRLVVSGDEVYGAFRDTPDSTDCARLLRARWAQTTTAAGTALLDINLP